MALAQPPDLMPTILELAGVPAPETVQGRSLVSSLRGERDESRPIAVTSPAIIYGTLTQAFTTITDDEWSLIYPGARFEPGETAASEIVDSMRRVHKPIYQGAGGPELYHLPSDPKQQKNVFAANRQVAERLHREHVRLLEELGTPEEHLANRRELVG